MLTPESVALVPVTSSVETKTNDTQAELKDTGKAVSEALSSAGDKISDKLKDTDIISELLGWWATNLWGTGPPRYTVFTLTPTLSFCPISAGLFFGSLFSVAVTHNSKIIMHLLYGIGSIPKDFI